MRNVTLSAKWLGVVFAALFLAACSSNETKEAEAAAALAAPMEDDLAADVFGDDIESTFIETPESRD